MQGHLRGESLSFTIDTECGHCHKRLQLAIDSDLDMRVWSDGAEPIIYVPLLDFDKLDDPSIIDAF